MKNSATVAFTAAVFVLAMLTWTAVGDSTRSPNLLAANVNKVDGTDAVRVARFRLSVTRAVPTPVACMRDGYLDLTWSPDGKQISYATGTIASAGEALCRMRRDGAVVRLVASPSACELDWSPDGRTFVLSDCNGRRILTLGVDGRNMSQIKEVDGRRPEWSPDGKKIVYVRNDWRENDDINVMNADGTGQRRVAGGTVATWSPDGKKLAVIQENDRLAIVNPNGRRLRKLRLPAYSSPLSMDWSPNGRTIVFAARDIYALDVRTSRVRPLTRTRCDKDPRWSPDGRKIGFISYRDSRKCGDDVAYALSEIYVMNADGTHQQRLTR